MMLSQPTSEIYVPDGAATGAALGRTTHMAIAAHQDDLEIMALDGILPCFGQEDLWFLGVIVTDGAGSPRDGLYAKYTDTEMRAIRRVEQKRAAFVGEYGATVFLDHPSSGVKNPAASGPKDDLLALLRAARPRIVYTHKLADKRDTHVAVTLRTIAAIRELAQDERPEKLYGCEVRRDLDWMVDAGKTVSQLEGHENLAAALLGVFDSQIAGGKRYDLATFGRRRAHATYHQSHGVDAAQMINFGMDLPPLVQDASLDIAAFARERITRFSDDVRARIGKSL
jgi:LmbE family N-acetylglucosaminyl deacetylase